MAKPLEVCNCGECAECRRILAAIPRPNLSADGVTCGLCGRRTRRRPNGARYCRFEGASFAPDGTFRGDAATRAVTL